MIRTAGTSTLWRPTVDVIVPHFDDVDRLRECLACVGRGTYPAELVRVYVVDNGSPTPPALDGCVGGIPVTLLCETRPGSYAARNRAVGVAGGEVLAFTDSDCLPRPEWIEAGVAALAGDPGGRYVGGGIEVFARDPERPTPTEVYERVTAFQVGDTLDRDGYAPTANLFVGRATFDRVGPFDATLKSGGDVQWGRRARASGLAPTFAPEAQILHPARSRLGEMFRKTRRTLGGMHEQQPDKRLFSRPVHFAKLLAAYSIPPPRRLGEAAFDSRLRGPAERLKFLGVAAALHYGGLFERARLHLGGRPERR